MKYLLSVCSVATGSTSLFGDVGESDPALAILDVVKLHYDLFFRVSIRLDRLPEVDELVLVNLAVCVSIDLVEELLGRDPAKGALPVVYSFLFIDLSATINIEDSEHFFDLTHAFCTQSTVALNKIK